MRIAAAVDGGRRRSENGAHDSLVAKSVASFERIGEMKLDFIV